MLKSMFYLAAGSAGAGLTAATTLIPGYDASSVVPAATLVSTCVCAGAFLAASLADQFGDVELHAGRAAKLASNTMFNAIFDTSIAAFVGSAATQVAFKAIF